MAVRVGTAEAVLTLRDEFTKKLGRVEARIDGFEKKAKSTARTAGQFGAALQRLGPIASGVGLAMAGAFTRKSIAAAIEQRQAVAQLEAALRSTGEGAGFNSRHLQDMASSLQAVTKFGDEAVIGMQSVLLTFTKIRGEAFERTSVAALNLAERMGTTLKGAAVQLGKALNDPVANLGELGRAGIQFSVEQKALIKTLAESGQLAKAQGIILEELETQFGGAAEAAARAAGGGIAQFKNAAGDLQEVVGRFLVPTLDLLGRKFAELVAASNKADSSLTKFVATSKLLRLALSFANERLGGIPGVMAAIALASEEAAESLDDAGAASRAFADGIDSALRVEFRRLVESELESLNRKMAEAKDRMEAAQDAIEATRQKYRDLADAIQNTADALDEMAAARQGATLTAGGFDVTASFDGLIGTTFEELGADLRRHVAESSVGGATDAQQGIAQALGQAVRSAMTGGDSRSAIQKFGDALASAVSTAITVAIATAVGGASGGIFGAIAGAIVGGFITEAFSGKKDRFDTVLRFEGVVNTWSNATEVFRSGAATMHEAAKILADLAVDARGTFNDLSRSLGGILLGAGSKPFSDGFGGIPDGGGGGGGRGTQQQDPSGDGARSFDKTSGTFSLGDILSRSIDIVVKQVGDEFIVGLGTLALGVGSSAQAAFRDALDTFTRNLPLLIEQGKITLAGIPKQLAAVLKAGVAQTFEELEQNIATAIELFSAQIGQVRTTVFQFFANLAVTVREGVRIGFPPKALAKAVTNQIREGLNQIAGAELFPQFVNVKKAMEDFAKGLADVGIEGDKATQLLEDAATAFEVFNQRAVANVLGPIADLLERFTGEQALAQKIRARAEQAQAIVAIETSRVQLRVLKEAGLIQRSLFRQLNRALSKAGEFARDLSNFMGEAAGSVGRVASSAGRAARDLERAGQGIGAAAVAIPDLPTQAALGQSPEGKIEEFFSSLIGGGASNPLDSLISKFREFWRMLERVKFSDPEREARAFALLTERFREAWRAITEGLKDGIRTFREQLGVGEFSGLFLSQRTAAAGASFQQLLARALGGDFNAIQGLQGAANQALQLGAQTFGTASSQFKSLRDSIFGGLDRFLAAEIKMPAELQLEATRQQTAAITSELGAGRRQSQAQHREMVSLLSSLNRRAIPQGA